MKKKESYRVDSFWPEASNLLDQHFARKKALKRLRIIGFSVCSLLLCILALILLNDDGTTTGSHKYETTIVKNNNWKYSVPENSAIPNRTSFEAPLSELPLNSSHTIMEAVEQEQQQRISVQGKGNGRNTSIVEKQKGNESSIQYSGVSSGKLISDQPDLAQSLNPTTDKSNLDLSDHYADLQNNSFDETLNNVENSSEKAIGNVNRVSELSSENTSSANQSLADVSILKFDSTSNIMLEDGIVPELKAQTIDKWKFAFVPSAGIFNTNKKITASTNLSDYVVRRTQEEENSIRESIRLGLELSKKRLTFQSGIYYTVYGERTAYTNWLIRTIPEIQLYNQVSYDTTFNLISYLDMGNFYENSVSIVDTAIQSFADTIMVSTQSLADAAPFNVQNRISYIELPLGVRYTLYRGSLVDIGMSAGGSLGFLWRSRGYIVNSELDEFVRLDAAAGLQKVIGNARFAADVRIKLSEKLFIGLRPEWNTTIGSVLRQNSIQQNYRNWGILLELKKTL